MLNQLKYKQLVLATSLMALSLGACSDCTSGVSAGAIAPPTVDDLPVLTNQPNLQVTGTRQTDTAVWFHGSTEEEATKAVVAGPDKNWAHGMVLFEGPNKFSVSASNADDTIFSDRVGPFVVTLDTIPPNPPVVDEYPGGVDLAGTSSANLTLKGTRDTDGDLQIDGEQRAPITGAEPWSVQVTIVSGVNIFVLTSVDLATNVSDSVTVVINGLNGVGGDSGPCDPIDAPVIDSVPALTNNPTLELSGTKPGNTHLKMIHPESGSSTPQELIPLNAETVFTGNVTLAEGNNQIHIYAEDRYGCTSPAIFVTVVLDTIAPATPVIDPLESPTIKAYSDVIGTRDAEGNLCLRREQEATCTEIVPRDAADTRFDIDVDLFDNLPDGYNQLCFSSVDAATNASDEVCFDVTKIAGPGIEFLEPSAGSVITTATLGTTIRVTPGSREGEEIATVSICLDADCDSDLAEGAEENTWSATFSTAGMENGSIHLLTAQATNATGATSTATLQVIFQAGAVLVSTTGVPGESTDVAMAEAPDGTLHFVWSDECVRYGCPDISPTGTSNPDDILHRTFTQDGWSDIHLISDGGGNRNNDGDSDTPSLAFDAAGQLHIAWADENDGDFDIYHRVLPAGWAGGRETLPAPTRLYDSQNTDGHPVIAAGPNGTMHLVWTQQSAEAGQTGRYQIKHALWSPEGDGAWAEVPTQVTTEATEMNASSVEMAVDSDSNAHIVWHATDSQETSWNVYYRYADAAGFRETILVSDEQWEEITHADSREPTIAIDSNDRVFVGWHGNVALYGSGEDFDVFVRSYTNGVADQQDYQNFEAQSNRSPGTSEGVSLAVTRGGNLLIGWLERATADASTNVAYVTARYDTTTSRILPNTDPQIVTETAENAVKVATVVDSAGAMHISWQDRTTVGALGDETSQDDYDIFYMAVPGE